MNRILIIDDEEKLRSLLAKIIALEGFEVLQASDIKSGLRKIETVPIDVVLSDVKLPDGNGVDLTRIIKERHPTIEVILLTAYGNIPDGVRAMKNGAFDYITKGDDNNRIIPILHQALEKVGLAKRVETLERQLGSKYSFDSIIGKSKSVLSAIDEAKKAAPSDTSVLLTGETGTGKEVFAQAIHNASNRRRKSFIAVNCSAFSKELFESELFGHKAGAFTGATKETKGILEEANNGTVFLDELGEMPIELQAKLLRVLETGEFMQVGSSKQTTVNVRFIAATNRDLSNEVAAGRFREDLYYRIAVFQIHLPSLSERRADIEELAYSFLKTCSARINKRIYTISGEYLDYLKQHHWKGNIRELRNVIERSVILTEGTELVADSLPLEMRRLSIDDPSGQKRSNLNLASVEKQHISRVLHSTNGNKTKTAEILGIAITTLYRKLSEYGIE